MRILIIDDDPDILFLAAFVLEQAGHRLELAGSGAAGLRAARTEDFDVVLLDYRLGDMAGADVLASLLDARPERPVAFLTGTDDPAAMRALLDAGASDVITKPFDPETLAARVEQIVRAPGQRRFDPGNAK